jgi:CRISPR-associated protein Csm1
MSEAALVALGGLLHDIGKFVQRANWDEKRTHEEWGYDFLYGFKDINPLFKKLAYFAGYHHKDSLNVFKIDDVRLTNLLWMVCEADSISASERVKEKPQFGNPLTSVFSSVNLGIGDPEKVYYDLKKYDPNEFFYPTKEKPPITQKKYSALYENFREEFVRLVDANLDFNKILALLEKYTTFIPSMMGEENDISLYDHLKTTSAIALCMYHYHKNELDEDVKDRILDRKEKKFILIGGDVSGIQDFIYTVSSKGALKYLRARSVYLELLTEDVVAEIVERLNLTRANVIYCGGGHFYILAPNTEEAKKAIEAIRTEVNRWLFERFKGKLYLAIENVELSGENLTSLKIDDTPIWRIIGRRLKVAKNRKFLDTLKDSCELVERDYPLNGFVCDVCKVYVSEPFKENDLEVCEMCRDLLRLGKDLPRVDAFVRWRSDERLERLYPSIKLPFSIFYGVHEIEKNVQDIPKKALIYVKNSFGLEEVYSEYKTIPYFVSDYVVTNGYEIKNFNELSKEALGVEKIAVLKMDVDNLGKIFSEGLKGKESMSRYATLSRFMSHFFKNCIRLIASRDKRVVDILKDRNLPKLTDNGKRNLVVVYSGGDDLFIVGTWNDVFEMAFEIRELFGEYVGWNPNLTISAGFAVFDPKYPLYRMAKITHERLENAKEEGKEIEEIKVKDRITLFERTKPAMKTHKQSYRWEEFKAIWNKYIPKICEFEDGRCKLKVSRAILWKILEAREKYVQNPKGLKWHISLIYHLSRAKLIDVFGDLAKRDVEKVRSGEPQEIYFIDAPLRVLDLAVRG